MLEVIVRRHGRASTLLTSKHPAEDWGKGASSSSPFIRAASRAQTRVCQQMAFANSTRRAMRSGQLEANVLVSACRW